MKYLNLVFIMLLLSCLLSCKREISTNEFFNKTESFSLQAKIFNSTLQSFQIKTMQIPVKNIIHSKLSEWIENNKSGWENTTASYQVRTSVNQDNFQLSYLVTADAVIISFKDKKSRRQQYIKSIPKGDLDFLTDSIN
jgi:23S rRNA G2445 N2-methylase RlmL